VLDGLLTAPQTPPRAGDGDARDGSAPGFSPERYNDIVMGTRAWVVAPPDGEAADLAAALGVHPLTAALLRRRGVRTLEEAERFLNPRLADLSDPETLCGMRAAVERVAQAVAAGDRIAIHGDYDVDGIASAAILLRGLGGVGAVGTPPLWYLPHRLRDGYGLGERAVEALAADGARLLIAADCGITAANAVARARALGVDVVVLDHHTPAVERPAAIIVEPQRDGQDATPLCAAGLALMFVMALRQRLGFLPVIPPGLVSLAALGTVADVVPLIEDNRRLVAAGLVEMRAAPLAGLAALAEFAGVTGPVTTRHVSWQLAPRLNAPGRLGDPSPALRLLLTDGEVEARALAQELDALNRERQEILERTLAEAIVQAEGLTRAPAFVVAGEGWHPGIVGLVAGRLTERYQRPAVAIGLSEGSGAGRRGACRGSTWLRRWRRVRAISSGSAAMRWRPASRSRGTRSPSSGRPSTRWRNRDPRNAPPHRDCSSTRRCGSRISRPRS
jgi:single-stranded-DNA-specific exonuclease